MKKEKKVVVIPEDEEKKNYVGAEWTGAELISSEYGKLITGKIYPVKEATALKSDGFKAVYKIMQ